MRYLPSIPILAAPAVCNRSVFFIFSDSTQTNGEANVVTDSTPILSPVLNLLRRWTFMSPIQWALADCPGLDVQSYNAPRRRLTDTVDPMQSPPPQQPPSHRRISTKRRRSTTQRSPEPEQKKPSPITQTTKFQMPPMSIHVYRALPANDAELNAAISASPPSIQSPANSFDRSDLPKRFQREETIPFAVISQWKQQIDQILHSRSRSDQTSRENR